MKTYTHENIGADVDVAALKDAIEAEIEVSAAVIGVTHDMESLLLSCTFNMALRDAEVRAYESIVDEHTGGQ